jgi:hypothetical protein
LGSHESTAPVRLSKYSTAKGGGKASGVPVTIAIYMVGCNAEIIRRSHLHARALFFASRAEKNWKRWLIGNIVDKMLDFWQLLMDGYKQYNL